MMYNNKMIVISHFGAKSYRSQTQRTNTTIKTRRIENLSLRLCNASLEENRSCVSEDSPKSSQPRDSEVDEIGKSASRAPLCTNNRIDQEETERKPEKQSKSDDRRW